MFFPLHMRENFHMILHGNKYLFSWLYTDLCKRNQSHRKALKSEGFNFDSKNVKGLFGANTDVQARYRMEGNNKPYLKFKFCHVT